MDLPLSVAADYLLYAIEKEKENAAWEMWIGLYPYMVMELIKPIKFDELKSKLFQKQYRYSPKSNDEIMNEMLAVVEKYKGR
ncbi:MAG: hypothetical protein WAP91_02475 [Bacilli bacterium]